MRREFRRELRVESFLQCVDALGDGAVELGDDEDAAHAASRVVGPRRARSMRESGCRACQSASAKPVAPPRSAPTSTSLSQCWSRYVLANATRIALVNTARFSAARGAGRHVAATTLVAAANANVAVVCPDGIEK